MSTVYVLNKDGKPLMPTTRGGHVRHLLKEQKARIVRTKPFTIQLLYETDDVEAMGLSVETGYYDPDDKSSVDVPKQLIGFHYVVLKKNA